MTKTAIRNTQIIQEQDSMKIKKATTILVKLKPVYRFFIVTFLLALCSCSFTHDDLPPELSKVSNTPLSMNLLMAKGFLGSADYERYTLTDNMLQVDCGKVILKQNDSKRSNSPTLITDPNLRPLEKQTEALNKKQLAFLKKEVKLLTDSLTTLPPPGDISSIAGKGLVSLDLMFADKSYSLQTSADAVASKENTTLEHLNALIARLKLVTDKAYCGYQTFYGIGQPLATEE